MWSIFAVAVVVFLLAGPPLLLWFSKLETWRNGIVVYHVSSGGRGLSCNPAEIRRRCMRHIAREHNLSAFFETPLALYLFNPPFVIVEVPSAVDDVPDGYCVNEGKQHAAVWNLISSLQHPRGDSTPVISFPLGGIQPCVAASLSQEACRRLRNGALWATQTSTGVSVVRVSRVGLSSLQEFQHQDMSITGYTVPAVSAPAAAIAVVRTLPVYADFTRNVGAVKAVAEKRGLFPAFVHAIPRSLNAVEPRVVIGELKTAFKSFHQGRPALILAIQPHVSLRVAGLVGAASVSDEMIVSFMSIAETP